MNTKTPSTLKVRQNNPITKNQSIFLADFESSFDDSFVKTLPKKTTSECEKDESTSECEHEPESKTPSTGDSRLPKSNFLSDVLPRLPEMSNGIKLLGVAETNPLVRCEDVYKLRYVRPDKPIGHSEIWEDCTTLRLTIFGKLVSDELQLTLCRLETAGFIPGIQEKDAVGTEAIKGVLELHDAGNLTVKPFLQRKASGRQSTSLTL